MAYTNTNILMPLGNDKRIGISLRDTKNRPVDISNFKDIVFEVSVVKNMIKEKITEKKLTEGGVEIVNPKLGQFKVKLTSEDMSSCVAGLYQGLCYVVDNEFDICTVYSCTIAYK